MNMHIYKDGLLMLEVEVVVICVWVAERIIVVRSTGVGRSNCYQ